MWILAVVCGILFGKFLATGLLILFSIISIVLIVAAFASKNFILPEIVVVIYIALFNITMWTTYLLVSPPNISSVFQTILR